MDGYLVTKEVVQGEKRESMSRLFEFGVMEGFISEAANLLLQRLLVIKALPSYFEVLAFDADSNICMCTYVSQEAANCVVAESLASTDRSLFFRTSLGNGSNRSTIRKSL